MRDSFFRYRQFFELDAKLKERFPGFQGQLPKKKVSGNMAPDFVNERKRWLFRPAQPLNPSEASSLAMRIGIDDDAAPLNPRVEALLEGRPPQSLVSSSLGSLRTSFYPCLVPSVRAKTRTTCVSRQC
jgi:hypothetical protein